MKQQQILTAQDIIWGTADTVTRITAVEIRRLKTLVNEGVVRARKLGTDKQAPTLYRISDVCDWIEEQPSASFIQNY